MRYGHIPLGAMADARRGPVEDDDVSIVVARHEAGSWPSREVDAYAAHRAHLIHQLDDVDGVTVVDYGYTDAERPNEIVEIIVAVAPAAISALSAIVVAWIALPRASTRKKVPDESVAGIRLRTADGTDVTITFRDDSTPEERRKTIEAALRVVE